MYSQPQYPGTHRRSIFSVAMVLLMVLVICPPLSYGKRNVKIRRLNIKPLSPMKVDRLNEQTRLLYQKGMTEMDRVNYPKAIKYLTRSVENDPDNVYLRLITAKLAHYLADTRVGAESIKYYDIAEENLRALTKSPVLNKREKKRNADAIEMIQQSRKAVSERDEKRKKNAREVAEEVRKEIYTDLEDGEEVDLKTKREKQLEEMAKAAERKRQGGGGAGAMGGMMMGGMGGMGGGGGGGGMMGAGGF